MATRLKNILWQPGTLKHPLYGLDFRRPTVPGLPTPVQDPLMVLLDHKKIAQKYEAAPESVGDNSFITGRRGLLPPSYPRRPSSFSDREVAGRCQEEKGDAWRPGSSTLMDRVLRSPHDLEEVRELEVLDSRALAIDAHLGEGATVGVELDPA